MNIERPTSNVEWEKAANREPLNRERLISSFAIRPSVRLSSRRSHFCTNFTIDKFVKSQSFYRFVIPDLIVRLSVRLSSRQSLTPKSGIYNCV